MNTFSQYVSCLFIVFNDVFDEQKSQKPEDNERHH